MFVKNYDIVCCNSESLFNENILTSKEWINNNNKYKVLKYNKLKLEKHLYSTIGICRSIIINEDKEIVCFHR